LASAGRAAVFAGARVCAVEEIVEATGDAAIFEFLSFFFFISHVIQHTHKRAGRRARNIVGAEALAVARRPEVASREKNPAAAGIRRFFPLSNKSKKRYRTCASAESREALARGPKTIIETPKTSIIHHHRLKQKPRGKKSKNTMRIVYTS